jgi:hypothetical protein
MLLSKITETLKVKNENSRLKPKLLVGNIPSFHKRKATHDTACKSTMSKRH